MRLKLLEDNVKVLVVKLIAKRQDISNSTREILQRAVILSVLLITKVCLVSTKIFAADRILISTRSDRTRGDINLLVR